MSTTISLDAAHVQIVRDIVQAGLPADAKVYVFGSRAKGTEKRGADLDLAVDAGRPISKSVLYQLADAFDASDLPYRVDVVDLHTASPTFRAIVEQDMRLIG